MMSLLSRSRLGALATIVSPQWPWIQKAHCTSSVIINKNSEEEKQRYSKEPFGRELMEAVADKLMKEGHDGWNGGLYYIHRDYCGHGLNFSTRGYDQADHDNSLKVFNLQVVIDGHFSGRKLGYWEKKEDFVKFWARQSDYSCSGYDAYTSSIFYEHEQFIRGNQRIDKKRLEDYLHSG